MPVIIDGTTGITTPSYALLANSVVSVGNSTVNSSLTANSIQTTGAVTSGNSFITGHSIVYNDTFPSTLIINGDTGNVDDDGRVDAQLVICSDGVANVEGVLAQNAYNLGYRIALKNGPGNGNLSFDWTGGNTVTKVLELFSDGTITTGSNNFTIGSSFYSASNGNIGIGNSTPNTNFVVVGTTAGNKPVVDIQASGSGLFNRGVRMLNGGMVNTDGIMYAVGRSDDARNMAQFTFHYNSANSVNNRASIGLHSVDDLMSFWGSNIVSLSNNTPSTSFKLTVQGSTYVSNVVSTPNTPRASLTHTGETSLSDAVLNSSNFYNTEWVNVGGAWNASTGRFTAPITGVYRCYFRCTTKPGTGTNVRLRKNGTTINEAYNSAVSGAYLSTSSEAVVTLQQGDYFDIQVNELNKLVGSQHGQVTFEFIG